LQVVKSRPNKNLLTTATEPSVQLPTPTRFIRVIAQRGGAYSPPSPLLELSREVFGELPPATVLQVRARRVEGAEFPNGYRDEYLAEEREIPAVP
jgi:hypothetical protein